MNYKEALPHPNISNFVQLFWQLDNTSTEEKRHTVLPDGYFDLIIKILDNKIIEISLYGIWTKQIEVVVPSNNTVLGVTLKPIAAEYIFKDNIANIVNDFKILDTNFWNITQLPFLDFDNFILEFTSKISKEIKTDNRKIEIFDLLFNSSGAMTVEELSKNIFWSSRQINRYFNTQFGFSLKTYANILRCSASYTNIWKGELSPSVHFYDQSHFIKEIKRYTGSIPSELHQNENDRFLQFYILENL